LEQIVNMHDKGCVNASKCTFGVRVFAPSNTSGPIWSANDCKMLNELDSGTIVSHVAKAIAISGHARHRMHAHHTTKTYKWCTSQLAEDAMLRRQTGVVILNALIDGVMQLLLLRCRADASRVGRTIVPSFPQVCAIIIGVECVQDAPVTAMGSSKQVRSCRNSLLSHRPKVLPEKSWMLHRSSGYDRQALSCAEELC
jgi:hypothetical protein